jgi:hypothetical protein
MLDLNDVTPLQPRERFDLDAIVARLRATAETWVPRLFPNGRRIGDEWRLANIKGAPPRKQGSCVIALKGEHAGDWHDFDGNQGGGPLSTIEEGTGRTGRDLLSYAADLVGWSSGAPARQEPSARARKDRDTTREIAFILSGTRPLAGTHAADYLAARGFECPASPDLLFHDDLAHWQAKRGFPGMIAIVRDAAGEMVAIHRTYLDPAKPAKADVSPARKTLGAVGGGAVRLAAPRDGLIGLAEGIETALAVTTACPHLPVWATLSTTGMEGIVLPPDIMRVVLLADHDDAGRRAAEAVAAKLAMEGRRVFIALPPRAGDDFNDMLLRDGTNAVRAAVEAAAEWQAGSSPCENSSGKPDDLDGIPDAYPLPWLETVRLRYFRTKTGRVLAHKNAGKDKNGNVRWLPIATPFSIPARLRHLDHEDAYGLRVVVRDMQNMPRNVDFPRAALARQGAADIRAALFKSGLRTEDDGDQIVVAALKAADPPKEILVVGRPGWHSLGLSPAPVFMAPTGEIIGVPDGMAIELANTGPIRPMPPAGTLEEWRRAIATAAAAPGCPHWILAVACAFAGPILSLTGIESRGINLSGLSTSGKSTAQQLAVSAWSTPDPRGGGLLHSMRSTENAIEALAQASSGTILALDELAHADGHTIKRLIYALAGGQGKARMTADAELKNRYRWATFALLSSECSLEEQVRGDGSAWLAGMAVRFVDVDVTNVNRNVDQATLQRIAEIQNHYGRAGPAFVCGLVERGLHRKKGDIGQSIANTAHLLAAPSKDSARVRAATCFALPLVAGELAQEMNILPWSMDIAGAVRWAWEQFIHSSDAEALSPVDQAISNLQTWILERWDVTVKSVETAVDGADSRRLNNRETLAWYDADAVYLPTQRLREAVGSVLKAQQIVKVLVERGLLARRHNDQRAAVQWVPRFGRLQCYALKRSMFGRSSSAHGLSIVEGGSDERGVEP